MSLSFGSSNKSTRFFIGVALLLLVAGGAHGQCVPPYCQQTLGGGGTYDLVVPTQVGQPNTQFIGVAATTDLVVFTRPYCQVGNDHREIWRLNHDGTTSLFGTIPDITWDPRTGDSTCFENSIAISPGGGAWAGKQGHVFVTTAHTINGVITDPTAIDVYEFTGSGAGLGLFISVTGMNPLGHSGIGFDTTGKWNYNMILGGSGANAIAVVDASKHVLPIFPTPVTGPDAPTVAFEDIKVAPLAFPGYGGWIVGVSDNTAPWPMTNYGVWAFGPPGCTTNCHAEIVVSGEMSPDGESINFVPSPLCTFPITIAGANGPITTQYVYFLSLYDATTWVGTPESTNLATIDGVNTAHFTMPPNSMIIQSEFSGQINDYSAAGATPGSPNYFLFFQFPTVYPESTTAGSGVLQEGASIVSCPLYWGCPATQGYWHFGSRWPQIYRLVDGVIYDGTKAPTTMTIGGIKPAYTQPQLLQILPSGSLHSGNYANGLSQFIAAVLNIAAGADHSAAIDAVISNVNNALNGFQIFCGTGLCPPTTAVSNAVLGSINALNNFNSAAGMGCSEGAGLNVGH